MPRAPPRKYEFPPNDPATGSLKICPFGLNFLMKLKFQRKFLKPKRPNFLLGPAALAAATTNLALRYMAQFLDHQEYKVN